MPRRLVFVIALTLAIVACNGGTAPTTTLPSVDSSTSSTTPAPTSTEPATTTTTAPVAPADLVYTNGDIVTMDPSIGTAEAIAITGELIVAVGTAAEIDAYIGPNTTAIDLNGRAVNPGFVDAHTHILTDMGGIASGQALALANGITSLGDASIEEEWPAQFISAAEAGELRVRTSLYLARTDPCGDDFDTWYTDYEPDAILAERVRVGGIKVFADGGVCGALAVSDTFLDGYVNGVPYHDTDLLTSWIVEADEAGYQVIIHAQGDLAIAQVQDAYETVLDGEPNTLRHRIEHNAFVTPAIEKRYGELGIVPTIFGISSACSADAGWTDFYKEFGDRPNAIGAANPGLVVAWHGDDPSLPPINPILELFSLVTRANVTEDGTVCEPPDWMASGGVTVEEGLAMMTTGSAYALRQDHLVGSLTPGKLADIVILSDNLLTTPPAEFPTVEILATVIGGVTEYCAPEATTLCPDADPSSSLVATASMSRPGHPPDLVLDGVSSGDSFWSSGTDPSQWIMVTFPGPSTVAKVRFVVFQSPPSDTVHSLEMLVAGEWTLVETFSGFTTTGDVLTWSPEAPLEGVSALRMTTLESLSWPEWYEIEIDYTRQ